jgi:hypothetical protein
MSHHQGEEMTRTFLAPSDRIRVRLSTLRSKGQEEETVGQSHLCADAVVVEVDQAEHGGQLRIASD